MCIRDSGVSVPPTGGTMPLVRKRPTSALEGAGEPWNAGRGRPGHTMLSCQKGLGDTVGDAGGARAALAPEAE
eukprot:43155-Alexandrium_andersonii.AAC.1